MARLEKTEIKKVDYTLHLNEQEAQLLFDILSVTNWFGASDVRPIVMGIYEALQSQLINNKDVFDSLYLKRLK